MLCSSTQSISASTTSDILISAQVKREINALLAEYPSYSNFINGIVNSISEAEIANDPVALNKYLMDLINQTRKMAIKGQEDYQSAVEKYEDGLNKSSSRVAMTYIAALTAYKAGIAIVKSKGCPNTARYMENAICGENSNVWPNGMEDYNTDWAYSLVYDCYEFHDKIVLRFENEILPTGANGTISGSFAYTQRGGGFTSLP